MNSQKKDNSMVAPTKPLVNVILGFTPYFIRENTTNTNPHDIVFENIDGKVTERHNIHEFASLCKQWLVKNNYELSERTWTSDETQPQHPNGTALFDMNLVGSEKGHEDRGYVNLCELDHKHEMKFYPEVVIAFTEWVVANNIE